MNSSRSSNSVGYGCVEHREVFQHPLVEDPPPAGAPAATRKQYAELINRAKAVCAGCPLLQECLYDAVVKYDVSGFVAGTTEPERRLIRRQLDYSVPPEDLDTLAGAFRGGRRIDHDEVVRLRQANPHESLEMLARRLDCSLSTVKRHLRRNRRGLDAAPEPRKPSMAEVTMAAGGRKNSRAA